MDANVIASVTTAVAFAERPSVGTGLALFGAAADVVLPFIPHDELRTHLDDAARRRANAVGDAALAAKFGA